MTNKVNPDNVCANLYKEFELIENPISKMFEMQLGLQTFMGEKRNIVVPTDKMTLSQMTDNSIYYFGAFVTEYFELVEAMSKVEYDTTNNRDLILEMQYEYIDMWHFLMNVFLYVRELIDLDNYLSGSEQCILKNFKIPLVGVYNDKDKAFAMETKSLFSNIGQFINSLPFKKWKTYNFDSLNLNTKKIHLQIDKILFSFIRLGGIIGVDLQTFWNLYMTKNAENFERQNNPNKGYI